MKLRVVYQKYILDFRFEAGTSRGVLSHKDSYFVKIYDEEQPTLFGIGECSLLKGLSIDDLPDFEKQLAQVCEAFNCLDLEVFPWNLDIIIEQLIPKHLPSVQFGFEMALYDIMNGGKRVIFDNAFVRGKKSIDINGLVWMGSPDFMQTQIEEKLKAGYTTIKMKIGAIDFAQECSLLAAIRRRFSANEITIRVDANGAFAPHEALDKMKNLAQYDIHSIEQPIKPNNWDAMAALCEQSPLAIALDEELIGVNDYVDKMKLLKRLRPTFIILKPSLLGGFRACREWIEVANRYRIQWWATSALESNIGLNAIAQFTATFNNALPQGLGTGQLYHNNIPSPLCIENGTLQYQELQGWDLHCLPH
jgi:o-succinylbenzoate synthase